MVPIEDNNGQISGSILVINDLSTNIAIEQVLRQLEHMAMHDPVTDMPNRRYVEMNIHGKLAEVQRYGWLFGVLFVMIDDFSKLVENYGNDAGKNILKVVAYAMRNVLRPFDILGRWRDEYFVVVVANVAEEQLNIVANRMKNLIASSNISIGANTMNVTTSIGGTIAREDDRLDSMLRRASDQMLQAKNKGGNCALTSPKPEMGEKYQIK